MFLKIFSDLASLILAGRAFQEFSTLLEKKFNLGSVLEGLGIMFNLGSVLEGLGIMFNLGSVLEGLGIMLN